MNNLRAPFPYFGGKRRVADAVWARLGDAPNYVEPFAGSAAVLLARPDSHEWWDRFETINDSSGSGSARTACAPRARGCCSRRRDSRCGCCA